MKIINKNKVDIDCPRCGGRGHSPTWPGSGICYRCHGKGFVIIDVVKWEKVLHMLRDKYRMTKRELINQKDPNEREFLEYRLGMIEKDGFRVSSELEYAKSLLESS